MGFFKNINIDIEDRPTGSEVKIGDVGKTTYTKKYSTDFNVSKHESPYINIEDIFKISANINKLPHFGEYGVNFDSYASSQADEHYGSLGLIPYGTYILRTNYNAHVEKYERFYKVEKISNHPDAAHFKRPDTVIRHACKDCAFYGRCIDSPSCATRYIRELRPINDLNGAIYFKYDKKNDKLINHDITPQISEDTKSVRMHEWLESMSPDQHIKCQEAIKFLKIHESHN